MVANASVVRDKFEALSNMLILDFLTGWNTDGVNFYDSVQELSFTFEICNSLRLEGDISFSEIPFYYYVYALIEIKSKEKKYTKKENDIFRWIGTFYTWKFS